MDSMNCNNSTPKMIHKSKRNTHNKQQASIYNLQKMDKTANTQHKYELGQTVLAETEIGQLPVKIIELSQQHNVLFYTFKYYHNQTIQNIQQICVSTLNRFKIRQLRKEMDNDLNLKTAIDCMNRQIRKGTTWLAPRKHKQTVIKTKTQLYIKKHSQMKVKLETQYIQEQEKPITNIKQEQPQIQTNRYKRNLRRTTINQTLKVQAHLAQLQNICHIKYKNNTEINILSLNQYTVTLDLLENSLDGVLAQMAVDYFQKTQKQINSKYTASVIQEQFLALMPIKVEFLRSKVLQRAVQIIKIHYILNESKRKGLIDVLQVCMRMVLGHLNELQVVSKDEQLIKRLQNLQLIVKQLLIFTIHLN